MITTFSQLFENILSHWYNDNIIAYRAVKIQTLEFDFEKKKEFEIKQPHNKNDCEISRVKKMVGAAPNWSKPGQLE